MFLKSSFLTAVVTLISLNSHVCAQTTPEATVGIAVYATTNDLDKAVEKALLRHPYKFPLFEIPLLEALPDAYKKVCAFLKKNPSAQNLYAFAQKNPKLSICIGVTSFVGIYALLFHGLSVFTKKSKKPSDDLKKHDDLSQAA